MGTPRMKDGNQVRGGGVFIYRWVLLISLMTLPLQLLAADMVVNGVALYQELQADLFWAGLYLPTYSNNQDEILAMRGQSRMEMRIVAASFSPRKFAGLWRDSIVINNSANDVEKFGPEMLKFASMMKGKLVTGDQITIDHSTTATVVAVNGNEVGRFSADFFPLLLRTWIGPRPASSDFKRDLLSKGKISDQARGKYNNITPLDGRNQIAAIWSSASASDSGARAAEDARIQAEAEAQAQAETKARADAEAKAQAETKARADAEAKAQAEAKARADAAAQAQVEAKVRADAEAKAQAEAKARAEEQARAQAAAKTRAEAEAKALAEATRAAEEARQASLQASADIKLQAEAQAKAKAAEQARLRAEAEAKARADAEAQAKIAEENRLRADLETKTRAEAAAKAQAEAKARADAEVKAQAEAAARADATAKAKAEAEARAQAAARAADDARKRIEAETAAKTLATTPSTSPAADDENAAVVFDATQAARELYSSKLVAWAYKTLEYPERDKARRNEGELKVKITINREGRVQGDVELLEQSRYASLNLAAKNGVKSAQPYPPIPANITGETFQFVVPVLFRVD